MVGKPCQPSCQFFQCLKNAIQVKRSNRATVILCSLGDDPCIGSQCMYANCIRKKLKSDLTCGFESSKPKEQIRKVEPKLEIEQKNKSEKWSLDQIPIKSKALKKIRNLDYDLD